MDAITSYTYSTAAWFAIQAVPLLLFPNLITAMLCSEARRATGMHIYLFTSLFFCSLKLPIPPFILSRFPSSLCCWAPLRAHIAPIRENFYIRGWGRRGGRRERNLKKGYELTTSCLSFPALTSPRNPRAGWGGLGEERQKPRLYRSGNVPKPLPRPDPAHPRPRHPRAHGLCSANVLCGRM